MTGKKEKTDFFKLKNILQLQFEFRQEEEGEKIKNRSVL
jgi:hypothetical protein